VGVEAEVAHWRDPGKRAFVLPTLGLRPATNERPEWWKTMELP
jgi:hypothetical protein